jgi:hypothetical protein
MVKKEVIKYKHFRNILYKLFYFYATTCVICIKGQDWEFYFKKLCNSNADFTDYSFVEYTKKIPAFLQSNG